MLVDGDEGGKKYAATDVLLNNDRELERTPSDQSCRRWIWNSMYRQDLMDVYLMGGRLARIMSDEYAAVIKAIRRSSTSRTGD